MPTKSQRSRVLVALMMGTFVTAMAVTVTNTMLPAIINDLKIPASTAKWLTSGATLVSGIMIPLAAYLMKRFTSRNYFIFSMFSFCIGSFLGFIAPNFPVLLIGRLIQAVGCGMLMPFAQVVLMNIYPKEKYGSVIGIFSLGSMVAPVISPSLAGLVIDFLGWQSIFFILLVLGIIILMLGFVFMKDVTEIYKESFPVLPVALSTLGFCGLIIGLGNLATNSFFSLYTGGALIIGLVSLSIFVYTQLHSKKVLMDLRVFRYPQFTVSVLISMFLYMVCMGSGSLLPIFTQTILEYNATVYALITLPGSLLMAFTSMYSGRIYDKVGAKPLMIIGSAMLAIASIIGIGFHHNNGLLHIGIVACCISTGTGFLTTPITTMGLSDLEGKERVDGSSILNTLRQISSSLASTFAIGAYTVISAKQGSDITGVKGTYLCFLIFSIVLIFVMLHFLRGESRKPKCLMQ
ncbi:MAG: DHA2 family efflux MFS transporter permease subunit [Lachnospiraceae bacterium]